MEKASTLKFLAVISALFNIGEINTAKKQKLLSFINDDEEDALRKELYQIREYSSCKELIDTVLMSEKTQEVKYGTDNK